MIPADWNPLIPNIISYGLIVWAVWYCTKDIRPARRIRLRRWPNENAQLWRGDEE